MSARGMLNGVQFSIDTDQPDLYSVDAHYKGQQIGSMLFDSQTGVITHIWSDIQRRGVATGMWNHARENGYQVRQAPESHQTKAGKAWARAVGD